MHSSSHDSEMVVHTVGADMNFRLGLRGYRYFGWKKNKLALSSKFQVKAFFYCGTLCPTVSINIRGRRKWVKFGPNYPFICSHNKWALLRSFTVVITSPSKTWPIKRNSKNIYFLETEMFTKPLLILIHSFFFYFLLNSTLHLRHRFTKWSVSLSSVQPRTSKMKCFTLFPLSCVQVLLLPNCLGNEMTEEVFSNHFFRLSDSPARGGAGLLELLGPRDHSGTARL